MPANTSAERAAESAGSKPLIIIMVKAPQAGRVKTRLCPPLFADQAAGLASCFVKDAVSLARSVCPNVRIAYAPEEGQRLLEQLLPPGLEWRLQEGDSLGERIQGAFVQAEMDGFSPLVMIGTDSPTLPPAILQEALSRLENDRPQPDLVLGPAEDGGYYLIGLRQPIPGLLAGVAWSTSQTLADTLRNAEALNRRVHLLPVWFDVDTPKDLERLAEAFAATALPPQQALHTYHWLQTHDYLDHHPDVK